MSRSSSGDSVLPAFWLPLVAVVALGMGVIGMVKVHQSSNPGPVLTVLPPQAPPEFNPKKLTYEVYGDLGSGGVLDYVDLDGHPHKVDLESLPWSQEETTMLTVVSGSISVQVRGSYVGCRILVNDVVLDEHTNDHPDADITCRVKSA